MKKILICFVVLLLSVTSVFAKNKENYNLNYNGDNYTLLYSAKNPEFGGYINEYYKRGETYNIWSEMIGVHHFPNAYSPIDQIVEFRKYLNSMNCPSAMSFDEDKNTGIIDFIIINNKQNPVIMEFNIFKYTKSDKCGSVALQYAKRYIIRNEFEAEKTKKELEKTRKKALKQIAKMSVPNVVLKDIDKCAVKKSDSKAVPSEEKVDEKSLESEKPVESNNEDVIENNEKPAIPEEVKPESEEVKLEEEDSIHLIDSKIEEVERVENEEESKEIEEIKKEEIIITEGDNDTEEEKAEVKTEANTDSTTEPAVPKLEEKSSVENVTENSEKQKAEKKHKKEKPYTVENTKDEYYAPARDYKEIIAECKRIQKEQKKLKKINAKKAKKARAKKAAKQLKNKL